MHCTNVTRAVLTKLFYSTCQLVFLFRRCSLAHSAGIFIFMLHKRPRKKSVNWVLKLWAIAMAKAMVKMYAEYIAQCLFLSQGPIQNPFWPNFQKTSYSRAKLFKGSQLPDLAVFYDFVPRSGEDWLFTRFYPKPWFIWKSLVGYVMGGTMAHTSVGLGLQCTLHRNTNSCIVFPQNVSWMGAQWNEALECNKII